MSKEAKDAIKEVLSLKKPLIAVRDDIPDIPRAAINNVIGSIVQLEDAINAEKSLKRPPLREGRE